MPDWNSCSERGIATLRCVPVALTVVISYAIIFSGLAAVFFIVLAGIKFMTSGGDPEKVSGARKTMTFSVLGLVLILLSFVALKIVSNLTGVECNVVGISC